jgi:toxin ParE1/3/4
MKVIIAREAIEDLVTIGEYIGRSNPARSDTFVEELYERCFALSDTPHAFARIEHRTDREIRRRPHGRYVILYEIYADRVDVLRILHGARDYVKILFLDN